jgi:alpha-glucoside transport system substrate-binding protein
LHRRLSEAEQEWEESGRDPSYLLAGNRLGQLRAWAEQTDLLLTEGERAYLETALAHEHERERATSDRLLHESQLRRRTRALLGLFGTTLLIVLLAVVAFNQRQTARDLAAELSASDGARQLVTESGLVITEDPHLSVLLAIEAIRATESYGEALPEAVDALHWALQASTIEYPAADDSITVAVRPNTSGPRGVFVMPPAELADLARNAVGRGFTVEECQRYFPEGGCPEGNTPIRPDLGIAGGIDNYESLVDSKAALAGTRVVVTGQFAEEAADAVREALAATGQSLGIEVVYRASSDIAQPAQIAVGDDPGDIVLLSQPGAMAGIRAQRPIVELGKYLGEQYLRDSYGDYLTSLGELDGHSYGLFVKLDAKSLIWYNLEEFAQAGYTQPASWQELVNLSNRMVEDGHTPWCMGVFDPGGTGWPITDWLETVVLRSEGPHFYDLWANHGIPFNDPAVVAALEKVGTLTHTAGYVFPDPGIIDDRTIGEALHLVSQDDPQCWMFPAGAWASGYFGDGPMVAMPFPAINPSFAPSMEGAGDLAIAMSDRPEVRAVIRAMASATWGVSWAQADHTFISPHVGFDLDVHTNPIGRSLSAAVSDAINAGMYRFDASDQMPFDVANGPLYSALVEYVTHPAASAEVALSTVEDAWIEDEANSTGD